MYEGGGVSASAVDLAGGALQRLEGLTAYDEELAGLVRGLEQALIAMQEAARDLRRYQERLVADPERLSQVEARLEQIARLKAKYGSTVEEILAFAEEAQRELDAVVNSSASLAQLEKELAGIEQELAEKALELSAARREVAREAAAEIGRRLALLNMPHARFEVAFSVEEDPEGIECGGRRLAVSRKGIDRVEFLFSANPGESLKPLARIASGGEMSRVALAIKTVMAGADPVPTLVFDEVDAGIGGETAERVADALVQLAASRQVLVVTHLAQIAALADRHLNVVKSSDGLRTDRVGPAPGRRGAGVGDRPHAGRPSDRHQLRPRTSPPGHGPPSQNRQLISPVLPPGRGHPTPRGGVWRGRAGFVMAAAGSRGSRAVDRAPARSSRGRAPVVSPRVPGASRPGGEVQPGTALHFGHGAA